MPKTNTPRKAGAKPLFTRHVSNSLLSLKSLRLDIEQAEEMAESAGASHKARVAWRNYRDHIERALDVRIDLLDADVASHEKAVADAGCPVLCRVGTQTDPSRHELRRMAEKQTAAGASTPTAA